VVVVPTVVVFNHVTTASTDSDQQRHLLMIVLDRWSNEHLHSYNPDAPVTKFDEMFENGLIFTNFYTSRPHTYEYFGILYRGTTNLHETIGRSMLAKLQDESVATKYITWHRNSAPEASAAGVSDYRGLRSYFLTPSFAWIPELLGTDYNLVIPSEQFARRYIKGFSLGLFNILNTDNSGRYLGHDEESLINIALGNIKESDKSFTLIHTSWDEFINNDDRIISEHRVQDDKEPSDDVPVPDFAIEAKTNDYRYDEHKYGEEVELMYQRTRENNEVVGEQIDEFIKELNSRSEYPVAIILTADHGQIHGKGRLWYTYHPNDEVIRVPLVLINHGRKGVDDRYFETPDITASIIDFFGLDSMRKQEAISFFSDEKSREFATTLTLKAKKHNEWWLVISGESVEKYIVNLHPDGNGEVLLVDINDELREEVISIDREISEVIKDSINKYGVDLIEVHSRFQ